MPYIEQQTQKRQHYVQDHAVEPFQLLRPDKNEVNSIIHIQRMYVHTASTTNPFQIYLANATVHS